MKWLLIYIVFSGDIEYRYSTAHTFEDTEECALFAQSMGKNYACLAVPDSL